MKTGGARGQHVKSLIDALESVGYTLARRSNSHFIYKAEGRQNITIPEKLEDRHLAKRIAKIAGASL